MKLQSTATIDSARNQVVTKKDVSPFVMDTIRNAGVVSDTTPVELRRMDKVVKYPGPTAVDILESLVTLRNLGARITIS